MKKQLIILIFVIFTALSCNSSNEFSEVFNQFIFDQTKLDFGTYPGVKSFAEVSHTDTTIIFEKRKLIFFDMFDPTFRYVTSMNENGSVNEVEIPQMMQTALFYQYNKRGRIKGIRGTLPYPVVILVDYESGALKSIYYEGVENNLFEYSNNSKNISCFNFELPDKSNGKSVKKGELLRKYEIEKTGNQQFVIHEKDAKSGNETHKYFYNKLKLTKEEFADGKTIEYQYEKYGNLKEINVKFVNKPKENIYFKYDYDASYNWTKRSIILGETEILVTERTITYKD